MSVCDSEGVDAVRLGEQAETNQSINKSINKSLQCKPTADPTPVEDSEETQGAVFVFLHFLLFFFFSFSILTFFFLHRED